MATNDTSFPHAVQEWISAFRRHHALAISVALVAFLVAAFFIFSMPNIYRAETRILVNPQRVSDKYVSSAVSMDTTERLNTLSQQVMSSSRLETIIDDLHLFSSLRKKLGRDQLIDRMRQHITIDLKQSADGPSAFTLSYTGDSPTEVAAVTNQLAASFIDWNLRDRASEAEGTTSFLSEELKQSKAQLDALEEQLRTYKMQHLGELPDQMQSNLQTLSRLQIQLQENVEAQSRLDHEAFLAKVDSGSGVSSGQTAAPNARQQLLQRIASTRHELTDLQSRYTDEFPAVAAKREELNLLTAQLDRTPQGATVPSVSTPVQNSDADPRLQLIAHDRARLAKEHDDIQAHIAMYQGHVDSSPVREQEIAQLLRDYDTAKEHYKSLLEKTYSAQMASELEHRQEGGTFTMLDSARVPDLPIGPNRPALLGGFAFFAVALGLATALLRESLDATVKSEIALRNLLPEIPLLGIVPAIPLGHSKADKSPSLQGVA